MNRSTLNITALEGLIKINSSFSMAIFLSIIITMLFRSLENRGSRNDVADKLLVPLVMSFKSFFFSWLVAQCIKLTAAKRYMIARDQNVRAGIMFAAFFSATGLYTLMGSLKQVTGAKTEIFSLRWSYSTTTAVGCLVGWVYIAIAIYFVSLCHLVFRGEYDDPE